MAAAPYPKLVEPWHVKGSIVVAVLKTAISEIVWPKIIPIIAHRVECADGVVSRCVARPKKDNHLIDRAGPMGSSERQGATCRIRGVVADCLCESMRLAQGDAKKAKQQEENGDLF